MRRGFLAGVAVALVACAGAPPAEEQSFTLPPLPKPQDLIEFEVAGAGGFRYFVDASSLAVTEAGVVRYTLVARSPSDVDNVMHAAIRCTSGEYRIHALSRDAAWAARDAPWRPILGARMQRWHATLYKEYFCPQNEPIRTVAEGVRALREGGHPFAKGFGR